VDARLRQGEAVYDLYGTTITQRLNVDGRVFQPDVLTVQAATGYPLHVKVGGYRVRDDGSPSKQRAVIMHGRWSGIRIDQAPGWIQKIVRQSGLMTDPDSQP
jgi:hypothetical protein